MTSLFPNAWHVARREYLTRVRSRPFAIVTGLLAILGLAIALMPIGIQLIAGNKPVSIGLYADDAALRSSVATSLQAILKGSGTASGSDTSYAIRTVDTEAAGRASVRGGDLDGLVTVQRGADDELTFDFFGDQRPTNTTVGVVRQALIQVNIGDRLQRAGIDQVGAARIFAATPFTLTPTDPNARNPEDLGPSYLLAIALVILGFMAVLTYGQWVANSVAEEKSSRVMELLITAASPRQLMAGKVLGTAAAGLTQYAVVVAAALVGLLAQGAVAERFLGQGGGASLQGVDLMVFVPFGFFFLGGFLLYATLYAGLGSLAARQEDVQQVTGPMILIGIVGYLAAFTGINVPDAGWVKVLSLIPFFSPYMLPMRFLLSTVAPWEWALAVGLMVVFLAAAVWIAARIYSAGVLLYGQRASLRAVFRAVRVAR